MVNTKKELFDLLYSYKNIWKALWELIEIYKQIDEDRVNKGLKPIAKVSKGLFI